MKLEKLVRGSVKRLKPFRAARDEYNGKAEVYLDANELPFDTGYNRYPDPHTKELALAVSEKKGVAVDQIIFGNGSDEIIDLVIRTFCNPRKDVVRIIAPTFGMYGVAADMNEVGRENVDLDHDFDLNVYACLDRQDDNRKVLFLCSPNNPTGSTFDRKKLYQVIQGWGGIVVLDEAYIEFSESESLLPILSKFKNLIILQTLSKARGGAALRLGMGFANSEIIGYLKKMKMPYNINTHTQKAALELLEDTKEFKKRIRVIKKERDKLAAELSKIKGIIKVFPSDANFLLIRCRNHIGMYNFLIHRRIIVRDRSKLQGCQSSLRFSIGEPKDNARLLKLIKEFYS